MAHGQMNASVWFGREDPCGDAMQTDRGPSIAATLDLDIPPADAPGTAEALQGLVDSLFRRQA